MIDGADEIRVRLSDGREAQATLVGTDPASLAAREAPIVRMGKWIYARIVGMRRNKLST